MASTSNQEVPEPPPQEAHPPVLSIVHPKEPELPNPPTVTSHASDSESTGHPITSGFATTVATGSQPKSPNSTYGPFTIPPNNGRTASDSVHDHNGVDRRTGIRTPKPAVLPTDDRFRVSRAQGLDWIVPTSTEKLREKSVSERLQPTLDVAIKERDKYASNARIQGFAINGCIGLQVVVGALTTGVAAAVSGKQVQIGVSILGGMSTVLASYLARVRGSGEPESSTLRARELDTFIREVDAWSLDYGHLVGSEYDDKINKFRERFENIIRTNGEDANSGGKFQSVKKLDEKNWDDKKAPRANGDAMTKV